MKQTALLVKLIVNCERKYEKENIFDKKDNFTKKSNYVKRTTLKG